VKATFNRFTLALKRSWRVQGLVLSLAVLPFLSTSKGEAQCMMTEENCARCHTVPRTGMSLTGYTSTTNLGSGMLKVFSVHADQGVSIGIEVADGHDRYALSLSKLGGGGFYNSGNKLAYQPDPDWTDHTTFFTSHTETTNRPFVYHLGVLPNTPADFYLLMLDFAGITNSGTGEWGQREQFYVQVFPPLPPAPKLLTPTLTGHTFSVTIPTVGGSTYYLEYRSSLSDTSWVTVGQVAGDGTVQVFSDASATDPRRFYRVRVQ